MAEIDWSAITRRNARSVQTLIGWIFWDPGALSRLEALGVPGPLGYIAARAAPLMGAGSDAVVAAFYSISPQGISLAVALTDANATSEKLWSARDEAVVEGLRSYVPEHVDALIEMGPWLWEAVEACPVEGRVFYGAHRSMPRPDDPLLSMWHAVNCLREWRGDTHWALMVAEGIGCVEAGILHNAWLGYETDWIPESRGNAPEEIDAAWVALERRGLAAGRTVTGEGIALRQSIEDRTDELCAMPWMAVGEERARRFAEVAEPPCEVLLARVDETAGPNYQPASRTRHA